MLPKENQGVYPIGVVAQLLKVHPETLRIWERNGIIRPARQGSRRLYSNFDLKRLEFIHSLIESDGLNLAGVSRVIQMYPCWQRKYCSGGGSCRSNQRVNPSKPCWKEPGTYCLKPEDIADICAGCRFQKGQKSCK